jgi:hypothetical protein
MYMNAFGGWLAQYFPCNLWSGCLKLGYRAGRRKLFCVFVANYVLNHACSIALACVCTAVSVSPETFYHYIKSFLLSPLTQNGQLYPTGTGNCQLAYVCTHGFNLNTRIHRRIYELLKFCILFFFCPYK